MIDLTSPSNQYFLFFNFQIPKLADLGVNGLTLKGYGSPAFTNIETWAIIFEMSKIDQSLTTFLLIQNFLGMKVIEALGSEEQKQKIIPEAIKFRKILAFGLTEPEVGSDASSLFTTAKKVDGGYLLNGAKRWIGNGTFADYVIIWARNEAEGGKVQGFIVVKGARGFTTIKIEAKYSLRITQKYLFPLYD